MIYSKMISIKCRDSIKIKLRSGNDLQNIITFVAGSKPLSHNKKKNKNLTPT